MIAKPAPVTVITPGQVKKEKGRCQNRTQGNSTVAYVCYNCGYGSHAETDCVVCGGYMRSNQKEAKLCVECGWTLWPENCAHCNQPLGTTKIKGHVCQDCSTGACNCLQISFFVFPYYSQAKISTNAASYVLPREQSTDAAEIRVKQNKGRFNTAVEQLLVLCMLKKG